MKTFKKRTFGLQWLKRRQPSVRQSLKPFFFMTFMFFMVENQHEYHSFTGIVLSLGSDQAILLIILYLSQKA